MVMSRKKPALKHDFSEKAIKSRRKFPKLNTFLIILFLALEVACVLFMIFFNPPLQDRIDKYDVYVSPRADGTLDIEYKLLWTPLDALEPLEWVYVGLANPNFTILEHSSNIDYIEEYSDDYGECHIDIYFKDNYYKNQALEFSFKINQRDMLCKKDGRLFYEFIPCWFNATPISSYSFNWRASTNILSSNADYQAGEWLCWNGAMDCGEYRALQIEYKEFNAQATSYSAFDDSNVYNELREAKIGVYVICSFIIAILIFFQVVMVDSFVSYGRGRGFLHVHGHHVHIYGHKNPDYIEARDKHLASHSGSRGGGGGCACACACAGGGRAGCSQKDTYKVSKSNL